MSYEIVHTLAIVYSLLLVLIVRADNKEKDNG